MMGKFRLPDLPALGSQKYQESRNEPKNFTPPSYKTIGHSLGGWKTEQKKYTNPNPFRTANPAWYEEN
jgi:hypothetical protein